MSERESQAAKARYRTIVADPPWPMKWSSGGVNRANGRGEPHSRAHRPQLRDLPYPTMSVDQICNLPIGDLAGNDAHLFLWIPDEFLIRGDAGRVAAAWGFKTGRLLVWRKAGFGLGRFPRPQHEAVVVCCRGSLPFDATDVGSVQDWKMPYTPQGGGGSGREHSRKPDGFLDLVERVSPGPYLELFARRQRLGWDTWGNEALEHVELSA